MMETLKKIAEIAILLPIAHLIACVIFLAGYVTMFGGNVSTLFAVSDSFTITLSNVFQIYAITLILPLINHWYSYESDKFFNEIVLSPDKQLKLQSINDNKSGLITYINNIMRKKEKIIAFSLNAISAIYVILVLYLRFYCHKLALFIFLFQMVFFSFQRTFYYQLNIIGVKNLNQNIAWVILVFIVTAFGSGMDSGDADRHLPYKNLEDSHLKCNRYLVLRSASSRFIVVGQNQNRYVINDKCEMLFQFPRNWTF